MFGELFLVLTVNVISYNELSLSCYFAPVVSHACHFHWRCTLKLISLFSRFNPVLVKWPLVVFWHFYAKARTKFCLTKHQSALQIIMSSCYVLCYIEIANVSFWWALHQIAVCVLFNECSGLVDIVQWLYFVVVYNVYDFTGILFDGSFVFFIWLF